MRTESQFTYSLLTRIQEFLQRQTVVTRVGDMKTQSELLDIAIKNLSQLALENDSRRRAAIAGTGKIRTLTREAKLEHMRPVAHVARMIFPANSQMRVAFRIPKKLERPEAVIDAMRGMADQAALYQEEFIKRGLAKDFVQRMTTLCDALRDAINARAAEVSRRSGSALGSVKLANEGRNAVRLLDFIVTPRLQDSPQLLGEWKSLLRQGRVKPSKPEGEESAAPAPAPVPAPAPASDDRPAAA